MMRRLLTALIACLLCLGAGQTVAAPPSHAEWNTLLQANVRVLRGGQSTEVDYAAMQRAQPALRNYLISLADVKQAEFDGWTKADQLAFLINAYNAGTVALILTRYPDLVSIKDLGSFFSSPWKKDFIPLLGKTRSLDDIEHNLIRSSGRYAEPRIHFAVNCASIGCPALRNEAFVAARLDAQLEDSTKQFLSDRSRNRLEANSLAISMIFKWYGDDFAKGWRGANSVGGFLALYAFSLGLNERNRTALANGDMPIEFLDYDWRLNRTP